MHHLSYILVLSRFFPLKTTITWLCKVAWELFLLRWNHFTTQTSPYMKLQRYNNQRVNLCGICYAELYLEESLSSVKGTSGWVFVSSAGAAGCSVLSVQVCVLTVHSQQFSVHLLLYPYCCSECLFQTPAVWIRSQRATTAAAGFSSAPCPEAHNSSSSPAEGAPC